MGFDLLSMLGLRAAAGQDIQLPNESGRTDPRLKRPNVSSALKQAAQGNQQLNDVINRMKARPLYSDSEVSPELVRNRDAYRKRGQ